MNNRIYIALTILFLSCSAFIALTFLLPAIDVATEDVEVNPRYTELYSSGLAFMEDGNYVQAKAMFEMLKAHEYRDSAEMYNESCYRLAKQTMDEGNYNKAQQIFTTIYEYKDSSLLRKKCFYDYGMSFYNKRDYGSACSAFKYAGDYENAKELCLECTYLYGIQLYKMGRYSLAIEMLNAALGYEDANQYILASKYGYAKENVERHDKTAYAYIIELHDMGYEGADELYNEYIKYQWKLKIMVNRTPGNYVTNLNSVPADSTWYFNIRIFDESSPGKVRLYYVGEFPDGRTIGDAWNFDFYGNTHSWASFRYDGDDKPAGTFKFYVYTEGNVLIGYKEIEITNASP